MSLTDSCTSDRDFLILVVIRRFNILYLDLNLSNHPKLAVNAERVVFSSKFVKGSAYNKLIKINLKLYFYH